MQFSDEQLCLIALCAAEGVGPASIARLRRTADHRHLSLRQIAALPVAELEAGLGLAPPVARAIEAAMLSQRTRGSVLGLLERLSASALLESAEDYPLQLRQFLGAQAPPVLFAAGQQALLERPLVAIVGSRRPSLEESRAAGRLAAELAATGSVVVSGGARGIDTAAHLAAARAGGTVFVPPMGVGSFLARNRNMSRWPHGQWCVLSQFPPRSGWRTAHALMRNRVIVALSGAVVAFGPRDTGGTWHSSMAALGMRKPLFVVAGGRRPGAKARGMRRLVRLGAVALDSSRMPDPAALAQLVADYSPMTLTEQLPLFDPAGRLE